MPKGVRGSKKTQTFICEGCGKTATREVETRGGVAQVLKSCSADCAREVAAETRRQQGAERRAERRAKGSPYEVPLEGDELLYFWGLAKIRGIKECWPWAGDNTDGKPRVFVREAKYMAHRVAWVIANGPIADHEIMVFRDCVSQGCVNPDHMSLGTQDDKKIDSSLVGIHDIPLVYLERFFLDNYTVNYSTNQPNGPCWDWNGTTTQNGYGQLATVVHGKSKSFIAHRLGLELLEGQKPSHIQACHTCDRPVCINPDHLFWGDSKANSDDKVSKNRQARGESSGHSILTEDDVREIRSCARRGIPRAELSERFGVAKATIENIVRWVTWRHVKDLKNG